MLGYFDLGGSYIFGMSDNNPNFFRNPVRRFTVSFIEWRFSGEVRKSSTSRYGDQTDDAISINCLYCWHGAFQ